MNLYLFEYAVKDGQIMLYPVRTVENTSIWLTFLKKNSPLIGSKERKRLIWVPGLESLILRYQEYLMANTLPPISLLDSSPFLK